MEYQIKTCLLKDYPSTIGFKFIEKDPVFAASIANMNQKAAAIYIHGIGEEGAETIDLIAINFNLEFAKIVADRLDPNDFINVKQESPSFTVHDNINMRIILNSIKTPDGTILTSYHVHDYKTHSDKNGKTYGVDGGREYLRRIGEAEDCEDLSISVDETKINEEFDKIREHICWGTRGKEGDQELKFKPTPPNRDIIDINNLPNYGFLFFFKNIKGYKAKFILFTAISVLATLTGFAGTWLLSYMISNITTVTIHGILTIFLPVYAIMVTATQICGYYTRKYGEMLPVAYTNHLHLRFFNTWLNYRSNHLLNFSKEKIQIYTDKYIAYVNGFLADWNWGMSRHITTLLIIIGILWYQSPWVLLINLGYMTGFVALSMYLSRIIAKPIREYHDADNEQQGIKQNFIHNLNSIRKKHKNEFFVKFYEDYIKITNTKMEPIRRIHAKRWFLQFNLWNLTFIFTFFYGIYQVTTGQLPVGYILLLQYAFNNLINIVIYFVEYYSSLINQKQDNLIFKKDIESLHLLPITQKDFDASKFKEIELTGAEVRFITGKGPLEYEEGSGKFINSPTRKIITIGDFKIRKGEKIAIIGESGSGKSTLANLLLSQVNFNGLVDLDRPDYPTASIIYCNATLPIIKGMVYVNSTDPLLNMSINDNIRSGGPDHNPKFTSIFKGLTLDTFLHPKDMYDKVGSKYVNLSTGQAQRIKLAGALYQEGEIYILDEPYNGIDDENKQKCMEFMNQELKDKTVILITHNQAEIPEGYIRYRFQESTLKKVIN